MSNKLVNDVNEKEILGRIGSRESERDFAEDKEKAKEKEKYAGLETW